jgi:SAM-dependent methyltransferase
MIAFLQREVRDERFSYVFLDVFHALYHRRGRRLSADSMLPLEPGSFDVVCLFSVITHQNPDESRAIFSMLRRYVRADGHLFFTCFLDASIADYEDRSPERNGGRCFYQPDFLTALVERCGWRVVSRAPGQGPLIGDSFVGRPA